MGKVWGAWFLCCPRRHRSPQPSLAIPATHAHQTCAHTPLPSSSSTDAYSDLEELLSEFPTLPAPLVLTVLREAGGRVITASRRLAELAAEDAARSAPAPRPSAARPRPPPRL